MVLQSLYQSGVARERKPQRVVGTEGKSIPETARERCLDGMIQVVKFRRVLFDGAEAAVRSQQIACICRGARHGAGAERRVLVLRQVSGSDIHGVEIHPRSALERSKPIEAAV